MSLANLAVDFGAKAAETGAKLAFDGAKSTAKTAVDAGSDFAARLASLNDAGQASSSSPNSAGKNGGTVTKTDTSNLDAAKDAADRGDFEGALQSALNSEGDSVELEIGVNASLPIVIPGTKIGASESVAVGVERTEDGYDVSLSGEQAIQLGLEVDDDLQAQVEAGLETEITYSYDTVEEAAQGLKDLAITAGNHPAADEAAGLLENAADLADGAANSGVADAIFNGIGHAIGGPVFGGAAGDFIGDQVQNLTGLAEEKTNELEIAINDAQSRLNSAQSSYTVAGFVGANADLGLPLPVDVKGLELGVSTGVEARFSTTVNADGTASVEISYTQTASGEAGFGATANGEVSNSVSISQDLVQNQDGRYVRDGSAEVTFESDVSGAVGGGIGITDEIGAGQTVSYTIEADGLNGELRDAADAFLQGDIDGALQELGSIEGDLEVQRNVTGSVGFEIGGGFAGAKIGIEGGLTITDQSEADVTEDVSIAEGLEAIADTATEYAEYAR
jgi:hypothetical protein